MATNLIKGDVHTVLWTNGTGADVVSGTPVALGSTDGKPARVGVLLVDVADGESGAVAVTGCFTLPKVADAVIAQGESLLWDASEGAVDDCSETASIGDVSSFGMADLGAGAGVTSLGVWIDTPGVYKGA